MSKVRYVRYLSKIIYLLLVLTSLLLISVYLTLGVYSHFEITAAEIEASCFVSRSNVSFT